MREGEREGKEVEELGGEGREEGGGEGVGAPFNVLPHGATDVVAPLQLTQKGHNAFRNSGCRKDESHVFLLVGFSRGIQHV